MATIGALIYKIGADISELVKNTNEVGQHLGRMEAFAGRAGTAIKGMITAAAIRSSLELADAMDENATAAGLTIDAYQELSYVFSQNGVNVQTFQRGIQTLNERLAGGDKSTVKAAKDLGYTLDGLKMGGVDAALTRIAEAVQQIPDPMQRTAIATDLFGKSGKQMVTALLANFQQLRAEAPKLSEETIKSLGKANDSWDRLITSGKLMIGGVLSPLVPAFEGVGKAAANTTVQLGGLISRMDEYIRKRQEMTFGEWWDGGPIDVGLPPTPKAPTGWGATDATHWANTRAGRRAGGLGGVSKEEEFDLNHLAGVIEWADELAKQSEKDWGAMWETVVEGYVAAKDAAREYALVLKQQLREEIEKQKNATNDLTLAIWNQVAAMNERNGLNPKGDRAMAPADSYEGAVEKAQQERDEKLRELDRQRAQLQGPSADPNSQQSRWLDQLQLQAETDYQKALREAYDKWIVAAKDAAAATDRMTESMNGFSASLNGISGRGGGNGAGRPGGPGGSLIPGMKLSPQMADALMYGATLDTIGMGNTPLRDSYIATKLADKDMTGLGQSGFTVNVNQSMPFNNDPASLANLQAMIQQAILDALKRQGMA